MEKYFFFKNRVQDPLSVDVLNIIAKLMRDIFETAIRGDKPAEYDENYCYNDQNERSSPHCGPHNQTSVVI